MGDTFFVEQLAEVFGHVVATYHQLGAGNCDCVGQTPAVRMEHRDDRENHRTRGKIEDVRGDDAHRVEDRGSVLVENAFRIPSRPTGIADAARFALVALVPDVLTVLGGD